jgi:hypothetical protein
MKSQDKETCISFSIRKKTDMHIKLSCMTLNGIAK